jgi:hypothetical protein
VGVGCCLEAGGCFVDAETGLRELLVVVGG